MLRYLLFLIGLIAFNSCSYDPAGELVRETGVLAAVTAIYLGDDENTLSKFTLIDENESELSIELFDNQPSSATDNVISLAPTTTLKYKPLKAGKYIYQYPPADDTKEPSEPEEQAIEKGTIYSILIDKNTEQPVQFIVDDLVTTKDDNEIGVRWIAEDKIKDSYQLEITTYKKKPEDNNADPDDNNNEEVEVKKAPIDKDIFFPFNLKDEDDRIQTMKLSLTAREDDPSSKPISFSINAIEFDNVKNITIYTSQDEDGAFNHRYFIHPNKTE